MPEFLAEDEVVFEKKPRTSSGKPRAPRARTDEQKEWDEAFVHAMNGVGYLSAQVKPDEADAARKHAVSAARLHGKAVTEGQARPGKVEGTVILSWRIRTPVKREKPEESHGEASE